MDAAPSNQTNKLLTAFERIRADYDKPGAPQYQVITHPYFSTGAFPFTVIDSQVDAAGFTRIVLKCQRGTVIDFFGYAIEDNAQGAGLSPAFAATDAETNLAVRHQTNNEDFAIEGVAVSARGTRIAYPNMGASIFAANPPFHQAVQLGTVTITDPGSQLTPPELSSPLVLEDAIMQCIRGKVSFQVFFDRKADDHLARLDKFPEGGGNSYLRANGEPSHHNFFRLQEGYVWRNSNAQTDKLLSLLVTMEDDAYILATLPSLFQGSSASGLAVGALAAVSYEFTVWLFGRAFYIPSRNF